MQATRGGEGRSACTVVGVAGGSGSGKTTFAKRLVERLGDGAVMLSHDDYYKHLPHMTRSQADAYDFDSPQALDTHLLVGHVRELAQGRAVQVPSYDFATYSRTEAARTVGPASVVVVEGIFVGSDPALRELIDVLVFVDCEPDLRALRRVERDCVERGADLERAIKMYVSTTRPAHERYVEPVKRIADIVIPDALDERALEVLARGIARGRKGLADA